MLVILTDRYTEINILPPSTLLAEVTMYTQLLFTDNASAALLLLQNTAKDFSQNEYYCNVYIFLCRTYCRPTNQIVHKQIQNPAVH